MPLTDPASLVNPLVPVPVQIAGMHQNTHDTFSLTIDVSGLHRPFVFSPGQFCMLYLFGNGEIPISISGNGNNPDQIVFTIRAVGQVSRQMKRLQAGDTLGLRGPFGTCWPRDATGGKDIVIVAGGIGLAPLRQLVVDLLSLRENYGTIDLFYGTRSPADLLFGNELADWARSERTRVTTTVDHGSEHWQGHVGVVTSLLEHCQCDPDNTVAMICGPEIMMRFTQRILSDMGIRDERIFISMERNMQCATGFCGHCQYGPDFICRDGPVFPFTRIRRRLGVREL